MGRSPEMGKEIRYVIVYRYFLLFRVHLHLIVKHTVGDLVYIENFGTPFLFVNSAEAAYELFVKRGVNYSSRPNMTMVNLCVLFFIISTNVVS